MRSKEGSFIKLLTKSLHKTFLRIFLKLFLPRVTQTFTQHLFFFSMEQLNSSGKNKLRLKLQAEFKYSRHLFKSAISS